MLEALQHKLNSLVGKPSSYISELPLDVRKRLNALKNIQKIHAEIEAKFREEVLELEKKYLSLHTPHYEKRKQFVIGEIEPTAEEAVYLDENEPEAKESEAAAETTPTKGIPEFWLTALKTNPLISETITDNDEDALKHLIDIKYYYLEGNPWKEDKHLGFTVEVKKQRHKATNKTRTVKKTVSCPTFFSFFSPPPPLKEGEENEEEDEDYESKIEMDYEIGEVIKEKIIPHAVDWFTGKALMYEEEDYNDYEGEDDEDFDDEDDEDEDDENDEDAAEKPQECKQQ